MCLFSLSFSSVYLCFFREVSSIRVILSFQYWIWSRTRFCLKWHSRYSNLFAINANYFARATYFSEKERERERKEEKKGDRKKPKTQNKWKRLKIQLQNTQWSMQIMTITKYTNNVFHILLFMSFASLCIWVWEFLCFFHLLTPRGPPSPNLFGLHIIRLQLQSYIRYLVSNYWLSLRQASSYP